MGHGHFLHCLSILDTWTRLGGELRQIGSHPRGRAFWRNGDGWNVSLDPERGVWYDFVSGKGGGILDLIETVLGCDRRQALEWAREFAAAPRPHLTIQQKREFARRRAAAEREAAELVQWRQRMVAALREYHHLNFKVFHACKHCILNGQYHSDNELAELMETAEQASAAWERAEQALDLWRSASWDDVLRVYRQYRRAA